MTVLEPMQQLAGALPEVRLAIDKRAKKLLDYDAQRAKVRKLVEKPDNDASKLPRVGFGRLVSVSLEFSN